MEKPRLYTAVGLMSGTSLDGIDAALIETDGRDQTKALGFVCIPYEQKLREALRACLGKSRPDPAVREAERAMTLAHVQAVKTLLSKHPDIKPSIIGFHGQTIFHDPANKFTWQIGDGALLASETGIDVVHDFRSNDVKAGGQGAPLLPLYHLAKAEALEKPVAILNLGGVGNVTYIDDGELIAFDTGPGNALLDDWVKRHTGKNFDDNGLLAKAGIAEESILKRLLDDPYFVQKPPKSLDRNQWTCDVAEGLSLENGAATLCAFTVRSAVRALDHLPDRPQAWHVTGGGRLNPAIMQGLRDALKVPVTAVDFLGWNGDALEAEGFAYLAVRSVLGLPLSLPTTTGVPRPMTGGVLRAAP